MAAAICLSLLLLHLSSPSTGSRSPSVRVAVTPSDFMPVVPATPAAIVDGPALAPATPSVSPPAGRRSLQPQPRPAVEPISRPSPRTYSVKGTASWGDFGGRVVTRLKMGSRITVVGPKGSWSGRSFGYGPARKTHRIVDLDLRVFKRICGSLSQGLCKVELRTDNAGWYSHNNTGQQGLEEYADY